MVKIHFNWYKSLYIDIRNFVGWIDIQEEFRPTKINMYMYKHKYI